MTATFINQTSRVAIAGRVAELQRQFRSLDEWIPAGDYHLPFGPAQARMEGPTQRALRTGAVAIGSANQMRGQSD